MTPRERAICGRVDELIGGRRPIRLLHGRDVGRRCRPLLGENDGEVAPPHDRKHIGPRAPLGGDGVGVEPVAVHRIVIGRADINAAIGEPVGDEIIEVPVGRADGVAALARVHRIHHDQPAAGPKQPRVIAQRRRWIEHIVECAAVHDEVRALFQCIRYRQIEIVHDLGAFIGADVECLDAVDAQRVKDRAIGGEFAVAGKAVDRGAIDLDGAGIHGEPMRPELRCQFGRREKHALAADEQNVALDGAKSVLAPDDVGCLNAQSHWANVP